MRPRFSIARLSAVIAFCAVAFASLRSPSHLWANVLYTAVAILLVAAAINTALGRGPARAFWLGFLIAGGSYFAVYSVPALRESICPRLADEALFDLVYARLEPATGRRAPTPPPGASSTGRLANVNTSTATATLTWVLTSAGTVQPAMPEPSSRWAAWAEPDRSTGVGYQIGTVWLVSSETFRQIGRSLLILVFAALAGTYARHQYLRLAGNTTPAAPAASEHQA